ncbi:hypothetical protein CYMTET_41455 [Cymbomonas tetramitiformis]|uniref:Uncharacterized protein n=1 Tax=Cymbomonas tetramitiformis TaxID=36881 RepID=A0AAE0C829_9CHLO|nr:hypothetical protein CYMTET_41455 [Cymbomonas tetramitiformis]
MVVILSPLRLNVVSKALRLEGHFTGTAYMREAVEFLFPTLAFLWIASSRRRWYFKHRHKLISGYFLFITCHPFLFGSGLSFNRLTTTQHVFTVGVAFAGSFLLWAPPKWVALRILLGLVVYPGLSYFWSSDIVSTAKFLSAIFALPIFLACKVESYMLNRYRQIAPRRQDVGDVLDAFVERKATASTCVWLRNELRMRCGTRLLRTRRLFYHRLILRQTTTTTPSWRGQAAPPGPGQAGHHGRVRKENRHRAWGKALRTYVGAWRQEHGRFEAVPKDIDKLGKLVVALRTEFQSAGLDVSSFDFENPTRVIEAVNELVYDTLAELIESGSHAEMFFESTDSSTERDGRRALLDLIKGCVPPGVRQSHQEEHAALRYPAREDPLPLLATEHRLVRENRALDWRPTAQTRKQQLFDRLDPEFYRAVLDRYPMPSDLAAIDFKMLSNLVTRVFINWQQQQADLGGEAGTAGFAAAFATGDGLKNDPALKAILDKITVLEHFIRGGCKGPLTPAMQKATLGPRGGLNGYLNEGEAHRYGGCILLPPLDEEDMQAMALAQVFQDAADCGPAAFAAAIEVHGAPTSAGGAAAELDMSAYGFSVPGAAQTGMQGLSTRLDDLVSATSVSFGGTMQGACGAASDDATFGYEGSTGGGTCGVATITPAPTVQQPVWPARTIECAAPHEIVAQLGADFQVPAADFSAAQTSVPPADVQDLTRRQARRPAVGCGVPPLGFGMPAMGAIAMLSLLCISFAGFGCGSRCATARAT